MYLNGIIEEAYEKKENVVNFIDTNGEPGYVYFDKEVYRNSYNLNLKIKRIEHGNVSNFIFIFIH